MQPVAVNKEQVTQAICWLVVVLSPPGGVRGRMTCGMGAGVELTGGKGAGSTPAASRRPGHFLAPTPQCPPDPRLVGRRGFVWRAPREGEVGVWRESGPPSLWDPGCPVGPCHLATLLLRGACVPAPWGPHLKDPGPVAPRGVRKGGQVWSELVHLCVWGRPRSLPLLIGVGTGAFGELLVTRAQHPGQPPPPRVVGCLPARPGSGGGWARPEAPSLPGGGAPRLQ